jgi:hypothetical protein
MISYPSTPQVESMKYQVHFDGKIKLNFRHKTREALNTLGWDMARKDRTAIRLPKFDKDMKEYKAKEIERDLPDFLHFMRK